MGFDGNKFIKGERNSFGGQSLGLKDCWVLVTAPASVSAKKGQTELAQTRSNGFISVSVAYDIVRWRF